MITRLISESAKCVDTFLDFTDIIEKYKFEALQMLEENDSNMKHSRQVTSLINMVCFIQILILFTLIICLIFNLYLKKKKLFS
jgi:hypothetical protein